MQKGSGGLGAAVVVALAALVACTPSTEKTAADPPADAAPNITDARQVDFEPGSTVLVRGGTVGPGETARNVV